MVSSARSLLSVTVAVAASFTPIAVRAQATDPAAVQINTFDNALLDSMKQAKKLGARGRFRRLEPVVERTFDLPTMTRFAVGPGWSTLPPTDQASLVQAFGRVTAATYAHNFDDYGGERFVIAPTVETRGPDKLVRTQLVSAGSASVSLVYRMRQASGGWKVIDVYYNGSVSSLTGQRAEFSATLRSGAAAALARKLNDRADDLLK